MINLVYYERNLPHYQPPYATYLVSIRLAGSLPREAYERVQQEYEDFKRAMSAKVLSSSKIQQYRERQFQYLIDMDRILDASQHGPKWLGDDTAAEVVARAIRVNDKKLYDLLAFTIMPNHVHIVLTLLEQRTEVRPTTSVPGSQYLLTRIIRQLKGASAREANLILNRTGSFWQHESFDHVIRDSAELERILWYVVENPVAAGLVTHWKEWRWTYCRDGLL